MNIYDTGPIMVAAFIGGPALVAGLSIGMMSSALDRRRRIAHPFRFGAGAFLGITMAALTAVGIYDSHIHEPPGWWQCDAAPAARYFACSSFGR